MTDIILILVLILIAVGSAAYIYREKKKGRHCIGCPHAGSCGGHAHKTGHVCGGSCGMCGKDKDAPKAEKPTE